MITLPADTPFFPQDLTTRLLAARKAKGLAIAAGRTPSGAIRTHPVFGVWPLSLANPLEAALGDGIRKVEAFTQIHQAEIAIFDAGPFDPFFNINTPEDLSLAEQMIAAAASAMNDGP